MPVTVNEIVFKLYSININELIGLPVISGGLLKKSSSTIIMCARTHVCVCVYVYIQKMHISVIFCYDVSSEALYEHKPFSFMKSPKIRWNYFWKSLVFLNHQRIQEFIVNGVIVLLWHMVYGFALLCQTDTFYWKNQIT